MSDQLAPGRDLNEAVAEHVFEWERLEGEAIPEEHRHTHEPLADQVIWLDADGRRAACRLCGDMPDFSGEWNGANDAWKVIDHLRAGGFRVVLDAPKGEPWSVQVEAGRFFATAQASNPAIAICRAALEAVK
jgi:hypothetical protein